MAVLDRKLFRDLGRLWAQVIAIALVMGCGVATIVTALGAYRSLDETRAAYYDRYRFGTVFASLTRAPVHLREPIASIAGVSAVELRIVKPVLIDILGMVEPATGFAVSIPDAGEPSVNRLYLRRGRLPEATRTGEVAVTETFAAAHGMEPGYRLEAVMNGRKRELTVTGIVLSPEYVYSIGPGDMVPDPRRFGVLFMRQSALAGLFDTAGAINDVALRTQRHAPVSEVVAALDDLLAGYGGRGAHDRADQMSHAFLDAELTQLNAMARVIPPVFLLISAFLVNMILSRLISLEREQIGLMKAVGYGAVAIGWHYAKLTLVIALLGIAAGSIAGLLLGRGLTRLYAEFFSFPFLVFRQSLDLYAIAALVSAISALAGSARAIWNAVRLPPAVAMQPPQPTRYRTFLADGWRMPVSQLSMMAFRHLIRWPLRSAFTTLGTSLAVALLVTALFSYDSIAYMVDTIFFRADRQDATVQFVSARAPEALLSVARLPGVIRAEGYRSAAIVLRKGHRERRLAVISAAPESDLTQVLDARGVPVAPPPAGLLVSERVAALLSLSVGDKVEVELLETPGRTVDVAVSAIVQSYVGLAVHMHPEALDRMIGDGRRLTGARLALDRSRLDAFYAAVKSTPAIGSVALQNVSRQRFRETIEENITIMTSVYISLAVVITFGVVYNSARIQLSERARELASLRVFGFTRGEVSSVLLIEIGVIVLLAQPVGWAAGFLFSWSVVRGFESDLFRIPLVIERSTFAAASLVVIIIALLSALIVRRRVDRLDMVRVLKTRD